MSSNKWFVGCDGELFDTSVDQWSTKAPRRTNYERTHGLIQSVADLKATLRAGSTTNLGGYPLYFMTSDGATLLFSTVRAEFAQICYSIKHGLSDGWRVVACDINYEDQEMIDDHTGEPIPSAYHDDLPRRQ